MEKINLWDLIKLIILSNVFMIFLDIFGNALALVVVYFKIGIFIFNWDDSLYGSLDKALAGGTVLGIGLWGFVAQISQQVMTSPAPGDRYTRGFLTGRPRVFSLFIALTYAMTSPTWPL